MKIQIMTTFQRDELFNVRPKNFQDFIGQQQIVDNLKVYVLAAKKRQEPLDHILFCGPPGLGKTTLANIISTEMNARLHVAQAPMLTKGKNMAQHLANLEERDVLFIDEIHRLLKPLEEVLYGAMEDFTLNVTSGEGRNACLMKIPLPRFTLIGATTRRGLLAKPLLDRFGIKETLQLYSMEDLTPIILRTAKLLDIIVKDKHAMEIAKRSRGTPRIANELLRRVRDFAQVSRKGIITDSILNLAFEKLGLDPLGLGIQERQYLNALVHKYQGGPVGIKTLSSTLNESEDTLENVYEPFMLHLGFVKRTPKGRMASKICYQYLQCSPPQVQESEQSSLFEMKTPKTNNQQND